MRVQGIYQGTRVNNYTRHKLVIDKGIVNGKTLNIYQAYSTDSNELIHKLYYLKDNAGNWIKSKLKYFKGGQCFKIIRSEANGNSRQ